MKTNTYDCLVIGAGHAGIEAALAASRMGLATAVVTLSAQTIGEMSCNPAVGGVGKGQLVREIDALGGEMGLAADAAAIQFRQLNASKGPAVRSSRTQADRDLYRKHMQGAMARQTNLTLVEDMVETLIVKNKRVRGVVTASGLRIKTATLILAAGTFLNGRMHIGKKIIPGGRVHEPASVRLTESLKDLGFDIVYFKTGTPPRLDGRTIDFTKMEIQHSDKRPIPFSLRTPPLAKNRRLLPC